MTGDEHAINGWIETLVAHGLRARAGIKPSVNLRRAFADRPVELHDLELIEALLA